jgi:peptidoglycan/xylan/chitin deacetylase (PgdA/CDA1 family)
MTVMAIRVALKVDCDTYIGTRDGVPRLLAILGERNIRATFFFTFGPDRSGVAARRFLTTPGFLRKMWKSRAGSLYGFPTALYGTLLPAPLIGERCVAEIRSVAAAGHETGVHAWDHVGWHDRLDRWPAERIRDQVARAHAEYERIFGRAARASAAAGWMANVRSLEAEEQHHLSYTSHTRGGGPFLPLAGGRVFASVELPTTLPTLDETLAWSELGNDDEAQRRFFRSGPRGTEVHTIHAEVEGRSKSSLFERILDDWADRGIEFVTLEHLAREALAGPGKLPVRELTRQRIPGRGGTVTTGWPTPEQP